MRLATPALLFATLVIAACSGKTTGTGTGSLPGATPKEPPYTDVDGGTCPDPTVGCEFTDAGSASDGGKTKAAPSVYDPLFAVSASTTATPNSLTGLWSGGSTFGTEEVRLQITASEITIALRCHDPDGPTVTVGLSVSAQVTSTGSMRVLDSKSTGTSPCQVIVRPQSMGRCSSGSAGLNCFDIQGTSLDFHTGKLFTGVGSASAGPDPRFEKLNDGT